MATGDPFEMAANRNSVSQSLTIALITFVMLTFVLAITSYLLYRRGTDASTAAQTAQADAAKAQTEMRKAVDDRSKLLQILGYPDDKAVADIETETTEAFEKRFGDYRDDAKAYTRLTDWLMTAVKSKDEALKNLNAEKASMEQGKDKALTDSRNRQDELERLLAKQQADAEAERKAFNDNRAEYEQLVKRLEDDLKKANAAADRFNLVVEEIAKARDYLAPERQTRFQAQPPEERMTTVFEELRDRERSLARQNEVLADLRVADRALQDQVLAATPKDDRIDGFDGRIVAVNEFDRSVLIDVGSTASLPRGLVMNVFDPSDPQPPIGSRKGVIEVIDIEGPSLARARIRKQATRDPLLAGDGIATSLWAPGRALETVFVGFMQVDADAGQDQDTLTRLVQRFGGTVEPAVSPATDMVVDGGLPRIAAAGLDKASGWRAADEKRREKQLAEARRLGIRVVGLDRFLDMMGLDRESFDSTSLAGPGGR